MEQVRPHPIRLSLLQARLLPAVPINVPVMERPVPGQGRGLPQFATTIPPIALIQMVRTRLSDQGSFAWSTITYSKMEALLTPRELLVQLIGRIRARL